MSKSLRQHQRVVNRRMSSILMLTFVAMLVLVGLAGLNRAPGIIFESSALALTPVSSLC